MMKDQKLARSVLIVIVPLGSVLFFQNCAPERASVALTALLPRDALETHAVAMAKARGPAPDCADPAQYVCQERLHSPEAKDAQSEEDVCLASGACLRTVRLSFNTAAAIHACRGCAPEEIRERYDHRDAECRHRALSFGGIPVVGGSGADLEDAFARAQLRCREAMEQGEAR